MGFATMNIRLTSVGSLEVTWLGACWEGSDEKNSDITTLVDRIAQDLADKKLVTWD